MYVPVNSKKIQATRIHFFNVPIYCSPICFTCTVMPGVLVSLDKTYNRDASCARHTHSIIIGSVS